MATDINRDIDGLNALQTAMRELKGEYMAITNAQKYDAQSTELLETKKRSLKEQLSNLAQQTELYTQKQTEFKKSLDSARISVEQYDKAILKLDQSKQKLHITSIALSGQLSALGGTTSATAIAMSNLASESNSSAKAVDKQTKSLAELDKQMRNGKTNWVTWANLIGSAANMILGLNNTFKEWNAINADGTPKMNASAKAAAILAISMQAVAMISQLAKLGAYGFFAGVAIVVGGIWAVANALNSARESLGDSSDKLGSYQGISTYSNRVTTQRSERTVNYNMNINANKNAQGFATNPQLIKALATAVDREMGTKIKR